MSAKLPKPVSSATDEQLQAYIDAHLPNGDKRVLAEEVLRLRKGGVATTPAPKEEEDPLA